MKNKSLRSHEMISQRLLLLLVWAVFANALEAQILPPPPVNDPQQQPSVRPAQQHKDYQLAATPSIFVWEFQFEGNRAVSTTELSQVTGSFTNRNLTSEELEQARRAVSLFYINKGYVNSGALFPDQDPTNGIIRIQIVEGVLTGIELSGNNWLNDRYINSRLQRWATPPLNLTKLQEGLQLLRQNPNVKQINAELKPGNTPGESLLDVRVVDQQPFRLGLQADNRRPPSVGAEQISVLASDLNVTGYGDRLDFRYGIANADTDGMEFSEANNLDGSYLIPLTRFDTTLGLSASRLNAGLVEETFVPLDVESLTTSYGVVLRQPVYQTANQELAFSLGFDHRINETTLLGLPYPISLGSVNGETVVSVLRFSQEWLDRGPNHVLALRSTFNFGLDVWDATDNGIAGDPDAKFFSWIGQAQYIRRLFNTQTELILRVTGQYTDERLLALEQFSVGGSETVRGYLENQLVRDRGIVSSVEVRVPILFNKAGAGIVHLAPFFDYGGAWNIDNSSPGPHTISSVGLGILLTPSKHFSAQVYWGHQLREIDVSDDSGIQESGFHFKVNFMAF